jgi:hypothetical protein
MRYIREEFKEDLKFIANALHNTKNAKLSSLYASAKGLDDAKEKLSKLQGGKHKVREDPAEQKAYAKKIESAKAEVEEKESDFKEAKALAKTMPTHDMEKGEKEAHEAEKAGHEKVEASRKKIADAPGKDKPLNLRKLGGTNESWKDRVKDYLGEGKGFRFGKCSVCKKTMPLINGKTCKKCSKKSLGEAVKFGFEAEKGYDKKISDKKSKKGKKYDATEEAKSAALNTKFKKSMKV